MEKVMSENFEINKEIVFSSSHIPESCAKDLEKVSRDILENDDGSENAMNAYSVYYDEYCYRIYVGFGSYTETKYKPLNDLIKAALNNGCVWLRIDRDGLEFDSFEKFDW